MLKTRVITAAVLLIVFSIALFSFSTSVFALLLSFIVAAAAWEWSRLAGVRNEMAQTVYASAVGLASLIALALLSAGFSVDASVVAVDGALGGSVRSVEQLPSAALYGSPAGDTLQWILLLGFLLWMVLSALLVLAPVREAIDDIDRWSLLKGFAVLLIAALAMQYLRSHADYASPWLLLYALSIVWFMDIGAYFSGRRFGSVKLAPRISPGKTWEGVYGGLAVTGILLLVVLIGGSLSGEWPGRVVFRLMVATLLAAGVSVIGDLYESRLKRAAGAKDSSQLLPGHGGVLDRIDGVVAALPVFAFIWAWL